MARHRGDRLDGGGRSTRTGVGTGCIGIVSTRRVSEEAGGLLSPVQ